MYILVLFLIYFNFIFLILYFKNHVILNLSYELFIFDSEKYCIFGGNLYLEIF